MQSAKPHKLHAAGRPPPPALRAPSPCGGGKDRPPEMVHAAGGPPADGEARGPWSPRRGDGCAAGAQGGIGRRRSSNKFHAAGGPPPPALRAPSPYGGGKEREHRPIVGIPVTHEAPWSPRRGDGCAAGAQGGCSRRSSNKLHAAGGPPPPALRAPSPCGGGKERRPRPCTLPGGESPWSPRRGDGCAAGAQGGRNRRRPTPSGPPDRNERPRTDCRHPSPVGVRLTPPQGPGLCRP
jgi:hypothetical protein